MKPTLLRLSLLLFAAGAVPLACNGDGGASGPQSATTSAAEDCSSSSCDDLCKTDVDCVAEDKPVCDGFAGCVECVLDDHCSEGEQCEDHACVTPQACSSVEDCTEEHAPVCNFVLGQCVECVLGVDCGDSHICNQGSCEEVKSCINSLDCDTGTVCDRDLGYCSECVSDTDCEETHTCVAHECISRCDSDKDCTAAGELCNGEVGYCVECVENIDCPELYHCAEGSCNVDVCIAGESSCNEGLNSREVCDPFGSQTYVDPCSDASTCVEDGKVAICAPWTCPPGTAACDVDGTSLVTCDEDGLGATVTTDCSESGGICENNACVEVVCDAGKRFCSGATVMQCSDSGTSFTSVDVCSAGYFCDAESQGCSPNVCAPNTTLCKGNVVRTCKADGSGYLKEDVDCEGSDQVCSSGSCHDKICERGTDYCKSGDAYRCVDNGARETLIDSCNDTSEYCEGGLCKPNVCIPGQAACDGEVTGICRDDGSGIDSSEGTDCSKLTDKVCWGGACLDQVCDSSQQWLCEGQERRSCINNGSLTQHYDTCTSSRYCDDSQGSAVCEQRICTANSPVCDGNRATTCNDNGSGYASGGTTCEADETCVSGTCLPVICTPNAYYCEGGNVQRCGADGTTSQLKDTCRASEYCEEGVSYCQTDTCTAGQPTCDGELVATCAADGSGPLADGVGCGDGETCAGGVCKAIYCTPGTQYCEDNYRRTCNSTGTGYSSSSTCSSTMYCSQDTATTTSCRYDICSPSNATCDGETLATCGADGGSYLSPGVDCSASDQLCDGSGCVDSLELTLGASTTATSTCSNYRLGNRYAFSSARSLTEIEQYLNITGTIQLSWVVYELDSISYNGTYSRVFEKLTTSTGMGFHSSGPIDVELDVDKHYLIGVRPAGSCSAYYGGGGKTYLASGGYTYGSAYEYDTGALGTSWYLSGANSVSYYQRLTFE